MAPRAPALLPALLLAPALLFAAASESTTEVERNHTTPSYCSSIFPDFVIKPLIPSITLKFHYGTGSGDYQEESLDRVVEFLASEHWHRRRCTVIYFFDHRSWPLADMNKAIVEAYLSTGRYNVLLVNWQLLAFSPYKKVVEHLPAVAEALASAINPLLAQGARLCQLAGHGMGAPLAALVNRLLYVPSPHIVGLDPLKELFDNPNEPCQQPLSAEDADCVEIVHTDFTRGLSTALGDVDFYVNMNMTKQPGCTLFQFHCSHYRAAALWAEAVRRCDLVGQLCDSLSDFEQDNCHDAKQRIGARCRGPRGNYYLRTNDKPPYGINLTAS